jgi:hypothetical protein
MTNKQDNIRKEYIRRVLIRKNKLIPKTKKDLKNKINDIVKLV